MARMRRRDLKLPYMTAYDIFGLDTEIDDTAQRKPISDALLVEKVERALGNR